MPANMMRAPVGSTLKVSGNSIAMVAIGPTPGSTPISVPTRQPRKHSARFIGDRAVPNPSARLPTRSNMAPSIADQPWRQRDGKAEGELEQADAERRHDEAEDDGLAPAHLVAGEGADDHSQRAGDEQSERSHREAERHHRAEDEDGRAQRPALERQAAFQARIDDEQDAEQAEQDGKSPGQHA